ncbi:LPXTG cell wall anchor domain-containing protein [Lactobacillus sp. 3B(2020)]|uniref:LPXTG cell wall anchor domain-containing protein n=1 Tax=Lactobacillus sp. 3B(2020) TaxID=2695882 RepID=UPI0015DF1272|nr:LPXTG cell wall anchor domain-containing protein [Lactobacillus sp. 3B(2020)]QLL70835.1 LPXTG cell wall anchor domain-containing protein [Lactobacillus sp. 3B(2020)]
MNEKAYLKIIYPQRIMEAVAEIRAYEAALLAADKAAETLTNAKNALEVANEALSKAQGALKAAEALAKEASQPTEPQNDNSQTPTTPSANGGETTPTKNSRPSGNDKGTSQLSVNNGTKTDNRVQPTITTASTKKVELATPKAVVTTQASTTKGATLPQTGNEKSGLALLGLALMSMLVMPVKRLVK